MRNHLFKRDGYWYFVRRVPEMFAHLDNRRNVKQTTKIAVADDKGGVRAGRVATEMNRVLEAYWRGLLEGRTTDARRVYDAARKQAKVFGIPYVSIEEGVQRSDDEILQRFEIIEQKKAVGDAVTVAAVLGAPMPKLMLSEVFQTYEGLTKTSRLDLSEDQQRKWRNPKKRAITDFISVVGDKPVNELRRHDALDLADWWQERVLNESIEVATANKNIGHIARMISYLEKKYRLGLGDIFAGARLEGGSDNSRPPYSDDFVQNKLLADGALARLNPEARRAFFVCIGTGMRLSEVVNLDKDTIIIDADIPHVQARPNGRRMKTVQSNRDIPLVGVALAAIKAQPNGFPAYRDKSAGLSAAVNKFLQENDLRETPEHSMYSARHTFKDRLRAVEAPDEIVDFLMGHKSTKPVYGKGPPLEVKAKWLHRIAFNPPSTV